MSNTPLRINDLPAPPPGRTGFPWTEDIPSLAPTLPGGAAYPKISIVTPSYQQGEFLEETIRSVLLQGYPNLEYVVIDGGSRDASVEIIQKYAPFLNFWVSEKDAGQANAINKGFARTTGEIMGYLNSDDILLPSALYWIARTFVENPPVNFVTGFRKNMDKASRFTSNFIRDIPTNFYMRHYCCIAQETTYWRRSAWENLGPLDESLHFALDYDFWLRAIQNGDSFHLIPRYTGGFRDYAENKSSSWGDVYTRDMNLLYQRYSMGDSEAEIHARLGTRWARRYALYVKISEQSWTNSPRLVRLAWKILEAPVLCDLILITWRFYTAYADFHQNHHQSRLKAFTSALTQAFTYLEQNRSNAVLPLLDNWEDVRTIPDYDAKVDETVSSSTFPADTLALGEGWFPTEFHLEYFRWCSGNGDVYLLNPSGQPVALRLVISPALPSSENRLDLLDDHGKLLLSLIADAPRIELNTLLPASAEPHTRYHLRWHGSTGGETLHEKRQLAFRLLGISTAKSEPLAVLQNRHEAFQDSVDKILELPPDRTPGLGLVRNGLRRLQASHDAMTQQLELWQMLAQQTSDLHHLVDAYTPRPRKARHFIVDCSTYLMNNIGDMAMFAILFRRLRARFPDLTISVITNDPRGIRTIDNEVTPVNVAGRRFGAAQALLPGFPPPATEYPLPSAAASYSYPGEMTAPKWRHQIKRADAVFLSGGGYFTDSFAEHATWLLHTLAEGMTHGASTFIVGCGFEPTTDALLNAAAAAVLPHVDFIGCREAVTSPNVLRSHGVDSTRFAVTGDDALELAYEARPETLGNRIGINLRGAVYNPVADESIERIRAALSAASGALSASLLPLPISISDPWDMHEISRLTGNLDDNDAVNTPDQLFAQIRQCRVIMTGSYHAAVFGLAMGIPVVALTGSSHYERKMTGLLAMFTQPDIYENVVFALDDPQLASKLADTLQGLWHNAEALRPHLLTVAQEQIRASHSAYEHIFGIINARDALSAAE